MSVDFTVYGEGGKIYSTNNGPESDLEHNKPYVLGHWNSEDYYVVDEEPTERPSLNLPEEQTLLVNQDWDVDTLPEGTVVYIDNVLAGETDDTALTMSFPLARKYAVKFDPPFPYKPSEVKVTVNETNA
jgi:hypothetical protein